MSKEDIAARIASVCEKIGGRTKLAEIWKVSEKRIKQLIKGHGITLADIHKLEKIERTLK